MNWKLFAITFVSIFLAELGDKTQLATIAFTVDNVKFKWIVFIGSALALTMTSFLGVFFGQVLTKYIRIDIIKIISAILFLLIGIFMLYTSLKSSPVSQDKNLTALINGINRIQKIEKCKKCKLFNSFINETKNKHKIILGIDDELHEPYYCKNCNTEALKKMINRI